MAAEADNRQAKGLGFFERYLTVWVALCIVYGQVRVAVLW